MAFKRVHTVVSRHTAAVSPLRVPSPGIQLEHAKILLIASIAALIAGIIFLGYGIYQDMKAKK